VIVVDASIAVKWTVDEPGRREARQVLTWGREMFAPELILVEVGNALRRKERLGQVSEAMTANALTALAGEIVLVSTRELWEDALGLSRRLQHSIYDCFYLALAMSRGLLVTSDEKLVRKAQANDLGRFVSAPEQLDSTMRAADLAAIPESTIVDVARLAELVDVTRDALHPSGRASKLTDLEPLFTSPAYLRLGQVLGKLPEEDLGYLVALGWLGRLYEVDDWPRLVIQARQLVSEGFGKQRIYIIAQMPYVRDGLLKLRSSVSEA